MQVKLLLVHQKWYNSIVQNKYFTKLLSMPHNLKHD